MDDGTTGGGGFRELVARDVRGDVTPTEAAYLRDGATLEGWLEELTALRQRIDVQLVAHKSTVDQALAGCLVEGPSGRLRWAEESAALHAKRARIIGFQSRVFAREREARRLMRERGAQRKGTVDSANKALKATLAASLDELRIQVVEMQRHIERLEARLEGRAAA